MPTRGGYTYQVMNGVVYSGSCSNCRYAGTKEWAMPCVRCLNCLLREDYFAPKEEKVALKEVDEIIRLAKHLGSCAEINATSRKSLGDELDRVTKLYEESLKELESARVRLASGSNSKIEELEGIVRSKEIQINELTSKLSFQQYVAGRWEEKYQQAVTKRTNLREDNRELKDTIVQKDSEIKGLQEEVKKKEATIAQLKRKLYEEKVYASMCLKNYNDVSIKYNQLSDRFNALNVEYADQCTQFKQVSAEKDLEIKELRGMVLKKKAAIEQLESDLSEEKVNSSMWYKVYNDTRQESIELTAKLKDLETEKNSEIAELKKKVAELETVLNYLKPATPKEESKPLTRSELGRMGGKACLAKYGPEFYSCISRKGKSKGKK